MADDRMQDYSIDEFKALRDEVKRCETEALSITLYVFSGALLATGLSEKAWLPKLVIPVLFQITILWGMHRFISLSSVRLRLSTYIQVMLEPVLNGLKWEGRNYRFNQLNYRHYYFSNRFISWCLHRFSQMFFLLSVLGFYVSTRALLDSTAVDLYFYVSAMVLLFLHTMSTLLMVKCVFLRPKETDYIAFWHAIKEEELNVARSA